MVSIFINFQLGTLSVSPRTQKKLCFLLPHEVNGWRFYDARFWGFASYHESSDRELLGKPNTTERKSIFQMIYGQIWAKTVKKSSEHKDLQRQRSSVRGFSEKLWKCSPSGFPSAFLSPFSLSLSLSHYYHHHLVLQNEKVSPTSVSWKCIICVIKGNDI